MRRWIVVPLLLLAAPSLSAQQLPEVSESEKAARHAVDAAPLATRNELERILAELHREASRRGSAAWPQLLAARTFLAMNTRDLIAKGSPGQFLGESHLEAAMRQLGDALKRAPEMLEARRLLADVTYSGGDRELQATAARLIMREAARPDALADAIIVDGRRQRMRKEYVEALASFDRALERGADTGVIQLERARTLTALGDTTEAVAAYWYGLEHISEMSRALYRQELAILITPDSLAIVDQVPDDEFKGWLARFWGERDASAANFSGERLREHLRRWVVAHERYRVPVPWRRNYFSRVDIGIEGMPKCVANATAFYKRLPIHPPPLPGDPRFHESLLDHRGLIYLKHGEPFARTEVPESELSTEVDLSPQGKFGAGPGQPGDSGAIGVPPTTRGSLSTWVYWVDGEWRTFNFQGSRALGGHAPTTLVSFLPLSQGAWEALGRVLPVYASPYAYDPCSREGAAAIRRQRADANLGIDTDSDTPTIGTPWNAPIQVFGVGDDRSGDGRALVTFAVPTTPLTGDTLADGRVLWQIHFRIVAFRGRDGATVMMDSVRRVVGRPAVEGNGLLRGYFELPLGGGGWQVATRAWQGVTGDSVSVYALDRHVAIAEGEGLRIGDLVPGIGGGLPWGPAGSVLLNTRGVWPRGGDAELWFELFGLTEGTAFTTKIEVQPSEPNSRRRGVTIQSSGQATGPRMEVRRTLGLAQLAAGTYRVTVTVTSEGASVSRSRTLVVAEAK